MIGLLFEFVFWLFGFGLCCLCSGGWWNALLLDGGFGGLVIAGCCVLGLDLGVGLGLTDWFVFVGLVAF